MRILGIDFSALWYRNWLASGGAELSESYGRTLRAVAEIRHGFDRVALLCDSGPSFRRVLLPTYKADRDRPPAPFYEQMNRTVARLMADGCVAFSAPRYTVTADATQESYAEADDLCAALAAWTSTNGHSLVIYGGDKDLLQLAIRDGVCAVWRPDHAGLWDAARVAADPRIGVAPERIPDWLALGGDKSDGFKLFPGWEETDAEGKIVRKPGIGPTGATKMIARFGSLMAVVDAATAPDTVPGNPTDEERAAIQSESIAFPPSHARDVIRRAKPNPRDAALLGLQLATLVSDLGVDFSPLLAEPSVEHIADEIAPMVEPPEDASYEPDSAAAPLAKLSTSNLSRFGEQFRAAQAMMDLAARFFEARMFGSFPNPEAIFTVLWLAGERGENVGHALVNSYVIKPGKPPGYLAVYLAARVKASAVCKVFRIIESTATYAVLEYQRTDDEKPSTYRFDLLEAVAAGWVVDGGPWKSRPRAMCRNAAMREAARAYFFDVVAGFGDADEYMP